MAPKDFRRFSIDPLLCRDDLDFRAADVDFSQSCRQAAENPLMAFPKTKEFLNNLLANNYTYI